MNARKQKWDREGIQYPGTLLVGHHFLFLLSHHTLLSRYCEKTLGFFYSIIQFEHHNIEFSSESVCVIALYSDCLMLQQNYRKSRTLGTWLHHRQCSLAASRVRLFLECYFFYPTGFLSKDFQADWIPMLLVLRRSWYHYVTTQISCLCVWKNVKEKNDEHQRKSHVFAFARREWFLIKDFPSNLCCQKYHSCVVYFILLSGSRKEGVYVGEW